MQWFVLSTLILAISMPVFANDYGLGDGTKPGLDQVLNSWNNEAISNGQQAESWMKEWKPDEVRHKLSGKVSSKAIQYCLEGKSEGAKLIKALNAISVNYEGYLGTHSADASVTAAYKENEKNLHSLYNQWLNDNKADECQ